MTVRIEAYLAIESGLSSRLMATWNTIANTVEERLAGLMADGDWQAARDYVQELDFSEVYTKNAEYIRYATYAALLFGASRLTDDVKRSVIVNDDFSEQVDLAQAQMEWYITHQFTTDRKADLLQLIAHTQEASVQKADGTRVVRDFVSFRADGLGPIQVTSALHTSRLSAYGFTAEAAVLGVTEYAINEQLDNRICPVCAVMHGKKFKVAAARSLLDDVLRVTDPDQLKTLQPWPKQDAESVEAMSKLTEDELVANHWHIPPFHPLCRGLLSHTDKVPKISDTASFRAANKPPKQHKATRESFEAVGLKITDADLEYWNNNVKIPVLDFLQPYTGRTGKEALDALAGITDMAERKAALGLKGVYIYPADEMVKVRVAGKVWGAENEVSMTRNFVFDSKTVEHEVFDMFSGDTGKGIAKKSLRDSIALYKRLGMKQVTLEANIDVGSYAWAKYGWTPTPEAWPQLAKKLGVRRDRLASALSEDTLKVLDTALASSDPRALWVIADLTEANAGKEMLLSLSWPGVLDLSDTLAMARFNQYIGG